MGEVVLYIDDQSELPASVDELLAQTGYELVHETDPDEALRVVREERPALVLVEVLHPGCDAFELIERMGDRPAESSVPVVVVTRGDRSPQLYGRALELGAKDFLCKPVIRAEILEAVLAFASAEQSPKPVKAKAHPEPVARIPDGDLTDQPLPELLARLHRAGLSGVLRLESGSEKRAIELRNGSPIEIARHSKLMPIADFLLHNRQIDEAQYEMLVDQLMAGIGGPRAILLGMDAMSEAKLEAATNEQARGALFELFKWPSGEYSFKEGERLEGTDRLELSCDPTEILLAGMNYSPREVVRNTASRRSHLYVCLSEGASRSLDGLGLSSEKVAAVKSLRGEQTLAEVLETTAIDERTFFSLCMRGMLELDECPVLVLDQELKPEPEEGFDAAQESDLLEADGSGSDAAAELEEIESTVNEIATRVASRDDFDVFGIDEKTADSEVHAAHESMVESLRLDRIPAELEDLRELATKAKNHLAQAYQRVRTRDLRRAFAGLRKKKEEDREEEQVGSRSVEAEEWFRKGKAFLSREEFHQALEAFGMAMHCDPEEGDYAAYLGYALYRTDPDNSVIRREALEHVANGVKLAPNRGMPLLFLGRIFRETGDRAMAGKVLKRALKIDPDNLGVVQELCLITSMESQGTKKGLLQRLRGR